MNRPPVVRVSLEDAHPALAERYTRLAAAYAERYAPDFLRPIFVARTPAQQAALFAQGREPWDLVNIKRRGAGLPPITPKENAKCVTWTLHSKHLLRPSEAIDVVVMHDPDGVAGPMKPTVDWSDPRYAPLPALCVEFGLKSGQSYGDLGHIELPDRSDVEEIA